MANSPVQDVSKIEEGLNKNGFEPTDFADESTMANVRGLSASQKTTVEDEEDILELLTLSSDGEDNSSSEDDDAAMAEHWKASKKKSGQGMFSMFSKSSPNKESKSSKTFNISSMWTKSKKSLPPEEPPFQEDANSS